MDKTYVNFVEAYELDGVTPKQGNTYDRIRLLKHPVKGQWMLGFPHEIGRGFWWSPVDDYWGGIHSSTVMNFGKAYDEVLGELLVITTRNTIYHFKEVTESEPVLETVLS